VVLRIKDLHLDQRLIHLHAKFADHLLLYRQKNIFGRAGLAISRSTPAQWVGQAGVQLQALEDALREVVLAQRVVHADESPVQKLAPGEKKTYARMSGLTAPRRFRRSRLWFMTLVRAERVNMRVTSSALGTANWCAMILLATKQGSKRV